MTEDMDITARDLEKEEQALFIQHFEIHGIKAKAAKQAGISLSVVTRWLKNDDEFVELYENAEQLAGAELRYTQWERGKIGWKEPVVYQGQIAMQPKYDENGTMQMTVDADGNSVPLMEPVLIRKFDNKLLVKENEARHPEIYKKRVDITTQDAPLKTYINFPMEDV